MLRTLSRIVLTLIVAISTVVLLVAALVSLRWRYVHDSPLMIYAGFLVTEGAVPYRDFFDMNMPGTYFIMWLMGRICGFDDLGFRIFDILCLASISVSTFLWMRPIGTLPAFTASVAFPLWYLLKGPYLSLQREYIALVPFAGMLAVATSDIAFRLASRIFLSGILAGATFLIKPHFLLLCLPVLIVLLKHSQTSANVQRRLTAFVGGMSIPIGTSLLYLLSTGSLRPFIDIAFNYWPLYTHMTGSHTPISGIQRLLYIVESTRAGLMTFYLPMAVVGLTVLDGGIQSQRHYGWLICGFLIATAIYPSLAGQFWDYHWIPFYYVALCAGSLSARPIDKWSVRGIAPIIVLILLLFSFSSMYVDTLLWSWKSNNQNNTPKGGVPDQIGLFLCSHMKPGDTVQPLDWTGGAVHGMLLARAPLATRFMYDFHFYHHINSPYIGKLRREFMNELIVKKPRFVIQVLKNKPWPTGTNTTRDFPELQAFLYQYYEISQQSTTYIILERRVSMPNKVPENMTHKLADSQH